MSQLDAITTVFARALNDLETRINGKIPSASPLAGAITPPQVAAGGNATISQVASQRIDHLDGVTITNATIIGGSVSGTSGVGGSGGIGVDATTTSFFSTVGHFTTGIIDAFSSVAGTISSLPETTPPTSASSRKRQCRGTKNKKELFHQALRQRPATAR